MESVRNRLKKNLSKKCVINKHIKQQSKMTVNGVQKPFTNYDSYTIQQNGILLDKPSFFGFAVLELSKLLMYETYYTKLQPFFGQEK